MEVFLPEVAVIIPVHNRNEVVTRAINSVKKQTMHRFECVIVDDCSEVPFMLTETDPRFKTIRFNTHRGVSAARNRGVAETTAPLIAFLDSDDEWLPKKLDRQLNYLKRNTHYQIMQSREMWIRNEIRVNPPVTHEKTCGTLFEESLKRCMITPSSVILHRSLFEKTGGFNESIPACEDYDLWLRITAFHPIGLIDEILLKRYGGHQDQLSCAVPALDRFRVRSMLQLAQHHTLSNTQQLLLHQQIRFKAEILANGYKKRGNNAAATQYFSLAECYGRNTARHTI